jgi:pimeloyl-ACP methyl ester carboxylesterase
MHQRAIFLSALCLVAADGRAQDLDPVVHAETLQAVQSAAPRLSRIALSTGVELEYLEQGSRDGDPIVFLHGYTDSYRSFDQNLPTFPRNARVYALSQRGHGNSSKPESGFTPADFAADVIAFMDAKGLSRATLVGHSMGSLIAHKVAAEHPDRVEKLVLIGSGPTIAGNPTGLYLAEVVSTLTDPVDPDFVREFQASTFALPIAPG